MGVGAGHQGSSQAICLWLQVKARSLWAGCEVFPGCLVVQEQEGP